MVLPAARDGIPLEVMQRRLDFSFFMMRKGIRRWGVHTTLYAADPWGVIEGAVAYRVSSGPSRRAARSFVHQAQEYFGAAERAAATETAPVLYYYSFLNLAKVLAMTRGRGPLIGKALHGVHPIGGTAHSLGSAQIEYERSGPRGFSVLDETYQALHGESIPLGPVPLAELVAQSVVAHRLWCDGANRKERFLGVDHVLLLHNPTARQLWVTLHVPCDTMAIRGRGLAETVREAHLAPVFRAVANSAIGGRAFRTFEQVAPIAYGDRPSDHVMKIAELLKPLLWQTVTAAPPYRRYYVYLSPDGEHRFPQWLSIYSILFWLGSLTRYQPVDLFELFDGPMGPFFREFLATQPLQLLYQFASEIKRQEVARAAVI